MTHVYTLDGDFNNKFDPGVFSEEIRNSSIATQLKGIRKINNTITIKFATTLIGAELTTLNSLVSNHNPQTILAGAKRVTFSPIVLSTKSSDYTRIGSYQYHGSLYEDNIYQVDVLAYADTGISSYDLRLYDSTNNQVLGEKTGCTNTEIANLKIETISNLSLESAEIEIQARKVGGGAGNRVIYFESLSIYFSS